MILKCSSKPWGYLPTCRGWADQKGEAKKVPEKCCSVDLILKFQPGYKYNTPERIKINGKFESTGRGLMGIDELFRW